MNGKQTEEHTKALNLIFSKGVKYYTELVKLAMSGVKFDEVELHAAGSKEQRALINAVVAAGKAGVPGDVIARQRNIAKQVAGYLVLEAQHENA